jgi:hypothetical protein
VEKVPLVWAPLRDGVPVPVPSARRVLLQCLSGSGVPVEAATGADRRHLHEVRGGDGRASRPALLLLCVPSGRLPGAPERGCRLTTRRAVRSLGQCGPTGCQNPYGHSIGPVPAQYRPGGATVADRIGRGNAER